MSTAASTDSCVRSSCDEPAKDGLDVCEKHHREIVLGLEECRAQACDERVPFGSLWCTEHAAMRQEGGLSASGELLNVPVEGHPCRLCGKPALKRTIGKRPQGGWNDLCQEHYDVKRRAHAHTLTVAREAKDAKPDLRRVPAVALAPPPPKRAPEPPLEADRRAAYLREHGWTSHSNYSGTRAWFLPVNVTQPAGGRSTDEAYEWQVGIESGRNGTATPTPEEERQGHADGCTLDADHDGDCVLREVTARHPDSPLPSTPARVDPPPLPVTPDEEQPLSVELVCEPDPAALTPDEVECLRNLLEITEDGLLSAPTPAQNWSRAVGAVYEQIMTEIYEGRFDHLDKLHAFVGKLLEQGATLRATLDAVASRE